MGSEALSSGKERDGKKERREKRGDVLRISPPQNFKLVRRFIQIEAKTKTEIICEMIFFRDLSN